MIPAPEAGNTATDKSLTNRVEQVLEWIARRGARHGDIASELYVSESTVKKHIKSILQKLGARNRAQAAAGWQVRRSKAQRRTGSVSTARLAADHL